MKLIRVEETGKQYQFNLPDLKADVEVEEVSSKQARMNKMLEASGKSQNVGDILPNNYLEMGYIYATISGYEYIKMSLDEFWSFINTLNALASIDSDELGFYGVNLFVPKINNLSNSNAIDLVPFELGTYQNNILGMCDALTSGDLTKENLNSFFSLIRYLG